MRYTLLNAVHFALMFYGAPPTFMGGFPRSKSAPPAPLRSKWWGGHPPIFEKMGGDCFRDWHDDKNGTILGHFFVYTELHFHFFRARLRRSPDTSNDPFEGNAPKIRAFVSLCDCGNVTFLLITNIITKCF